MSGLKESDVEAHAVADDRSGGNENEKQVRNSLGEAADLYGDAEIAAELGYVHRGYVLYFISLPETS